MRKFVRLSCVLLLLVSVFVFATGCSDVNITEDNFINVVKLNIKNAPDNTWKTDVPEFIRKCTSIQRITKSKFIDNFYEYTNKQLFSSRRYPTGDLPELDNRFTDCIMTQFWHSNPSEKLRSVINYKYNYTHYPEQYANADEANICSVFADGYAPELLNKSQVEWTEYLEWLYDQAEWYEAEWSTIDLSSYRQFRVILYDDGFVICKYNFKYTDDCTNYNIEEVKWEYKGKYSYSLSNGVMNIVCE